MRRLGKTLMTRNAVGRATALAGLCVAAAPLLAAEVVAASASPTPAPAAAPLENTRWALTAIGDSPARPAAREAYILLRRRGESRRLGGSGGCGGIKGTYDRFAGRLRIVASAVTGKPCPGPLAAQEAKLFEALRETANFRITGGELDLLGADGRFLARFSARPDH
jgi:heat shock protein HslJ